MKKDIESITGQAEADARQTAGRAELLESPGAHSSRRPLRTVHG